jgi:hypothetical protein
MPSKTTEQLEILVTQPHQLHELLDEAEALLRHVPQRAAGILVTRHDPSRYTLMLCDKVPFGETREQVLD